MTYRFLPIAKYRAIHYPPLGAGTPLAFINLQIAEAGISVEILGTVIHYARVVFQVKDIYLHPDRFSAQNSLLTAGLKPRRPEMRRYFKPQLDDLYAKLG